MTEWLDTEALFRERDAEVLAEVREGGPSTAAEIAREVGIPERTVRHSLKRLEAAGRVESDGYQRRARVYIAD